jgi:hypothetical protein
MQAAPTSVVGRDTTTTAEPFGLSQAIAIGVGIFFIVTGAIGLARTGVHSLRTPTAEVLGMGTTPLLGIIQMGVGILMILSAMGRMLARDMDVFLGALLMAAGIIVLIQPDVLQTWLAMNQTNGFVYLAAGALSILAAIMTPRMIVSRRHVSAM